MESPGKVGLSINRPAAVYALAGIRRGRVSAVQVNGRVPAGRGRHGPGARSARPGAKQPK